MSFADHDAKQAPPTLMHRGFTAPQGSSTAAWPRRTSAPRPARGWRSADRHFAMHRQRQIRMFTERIGANRYAFGPAQDPLWKSTRIPLTCAPTAPDSAAHGKRTG